MCFADSTLMEVACDLSLLQSAYLGHIPLAEL